MHPERTPAFDDLLEHADFVRAVARRVLGDEHRAEDVAQATLLAGLERPPRVRSLRAWLGAVARNLAVSRRRADESRRLRERAVAAREPLPPVDELVARLEIQRLLVDAVLSLDEPYRTTVLLRFFHGLTPAEVAARMAVPVETARTRQRRALALLRARLEERDRRGLLVLGPLPWLKRAATTLAGGVVVKTKLTITVAALALIAVVLAWRAASAPGSSRATSARAAAAPGPASRPGEARSAPPREVVTISGIVLGPLGDPAAGARVEATEPREEPRDAFAFWTTMRERPDAPHLLADARADAGGAFRLEVDRGARVSLTASAPGRVAGEPVVVDATATRTGLVLRLLAEAWVRGVVLDERERPVASALVLLLQNPANGARTDPDGAFALERVPPGDVSVVARADGYADSLVAVDAPSEECRVVLRRGRTVAGVVLDARHDPVDGAQVTLIPLGDDPPSLARTDASGRFSCPQVPPFPVRVLVNAGVRGSAFLLQPTAEADIEVVLDPVRAVGVRVVQAGADGTVGVPDVTVRVWQWGFFRGREGPAE